jgi:HPt (histidine-containing phosphotransfer) domain-containing protein
VGTVSGDTRPAVDASVLLRLDTEVGGVGEIVELYLRALPLRCGSIAQALADDDPAALRRATHTLRSASALVGAASLATLCERLEDVSEQTAALPVSAGTEVAAESRRVERELRALLATHPFR